MTWIPGSAGGQVRAQCDDPTKGDWVLQVKVKVEMTFDKLKNFSKENVKELVKKHDTTTAFAS